MNDVQELIKQISGVDIFQETRKQEVVEYREMQRIQGLKRALPLKTS